MLHHVATKAIHQAWLVEVQLQTGVDPAHAHGRVKPYQIHTSQNLTFFQLVTRIYFRSGFVQAYAPDTSYGSKFDSNTTLRVACRDLPNRLRNKMCASGRVKPGHDGIGE